MSPSFAKDIRPLFTEIDVQHMSFMMDLSSYGDVKSNSAQILQAVSTGRMPPNNPWPKSNVQLFQDWINAGFPQ